MKYYVSITEPLNKIVRVIADNEEEAVKKAEQAYQNGDIVLDYDNIVGVSTQMEEGQEYYHETVKDGFDCWEEIE